ncbi:hypothetical protein HNP89_001965 [Methanococcus maripaludis]|uniref:DUF4365 domain-containing protein n=1 Tax=Methanococcus maripaludis TaxID=39152 RepID=A0A7J9P344_METMI|nr:hypothetical protein [Methanococcus maripaludis]MBA2853987.1 hypothetical protein [Methanococcus maripaludis]
MYWLSKSGFECARVDHTGIDLIAKNKETDELMGISVKGRSRSENTENTSLNIKNSDFDKVDSACGAFGCIPYFALVFDLKNTMYLFIISKEKMLKLCPPSKAVCSWKMTDKKIEEYLKDDEIKTIKFNYENLSWWDESKN